MADTRRLLYRNVIDMEGCNVFIQISVLDFCKDQ